MRSQYLVIPMGPFASNAIGSHRAPPDATLFKKKSKDLFRNLFFGTRSQKGNFKPFPTKWYTLSLLQSMVLGEGTLSVLDPVDDLVYKHGAQFVGEHSLTAVDGDPRWWRKGWTMRWL